MEIIKLEDLEKDLKELEKDIPEKYQILMQDILDIKEKIKSPFEQLMKAYNLGFFRGIQIASLKKDFGLLYNVLVENKMNLKDKLLNYYNEIPFENRLSVDEYVQILEDEENLDTLLLAILFFSCGYERAYKTSKIKGVENE